MAVPAFQNDLHMLKERVAALSSNRSSHHRDMSVASAAPQDLFVEQLADLLDRLLVVEQAMQDFKYPTRPRYNTSPATTHPAPTTLAAPAIFAGDIANSCQKWHDDMLATHHDWNQKTEARLNEIEERLDQLQPAQFTPASSSTGTDDSNGSGRSRGADIVEQSTPPVCELYSDVKQLDQAYTYLPPIEDLHHYGLAGPSCTLPPLSSVEPWPTMAPCHPHWGETDDFMQAQNQYLPGQTSRLPPAGEGSVSTAMPYVRTPDGQIASPEGVQYRNREISRLDEQLRLAHESLRNCEGNLLRQNDLLNDSQANLQSERAALELEREAHQRTKSDLEDALKKIAVKDTEVRNLMHGMASKESAIANLQLTCNRQYEDITAASRQVERLNTRLYDERETHRTELSIALSHYMEESKKVKEFCERKDAVMTKQQENISWAAQLLEQKDAELESMNRRSRAMQDDRGHAERTMERLARLLGERDAEIERLRREADVSRVENGGWGDVQSQQEALIPDDVAQLDGGNWFGVSRTQDDRDSWNTQRLHESDDRRGAPSEPLRWLTSPSPRLQRRSTMRSYSTDDNKADEASRLLMWSYGTDHLGSAPMSPPTSEVSPSTRKRRGRHNGRRQRQTAHRHSPEQERPTLYTQPPEARSSEAGPSARANLVLPRDADISLEPPLPAPVTARRMVSEANLRRAVPRQEPQQRYHHLARHRSMMDLPPRRLHAYAETEAESGREV